MFKCAGSHKNNKRVELDRIICIQPKSDFLQSTFILCYYLMNWYNFQNVIWNRRWLILTNINYIQMSEQALPVPNPATHEQWQILETE